MRSFITGINSFIASHLVPVLLAAGDEVAGICRREAGNSDGATRYLGSVTDPKWVSETIGGMKPDRIFHLAAQSKIPQSFAQPQETLAVNVTGTLHVLEAVRKKVPETRVISVGSSAEYGRTAGQVKFIQENAPLDPTSPYAVSKVCQGMLGLVYARFHQIHIVHVRPFAIIGPGKEGDALGDFCQRIVAIESGKADFLSVGNLDAVRDFVDIRDFIQGLVRVADRGDAGEVYNLCNARAATLHDVVRLLQERAQQPFEVVLDQGRLRLSDDPRIVGDNQKLLRLGYRPRFTLAETVGDTLEYWRQRAR